MRRLTLVLALAFAGGCGGSDKKPDDAAPPPAKPSPAPAQPQSKPAPKPAPAPVTDTSDDGGEIKIKGSRHKESQSSASAEDAARRAKIAELQAKARASQGKDNGTPYREETGAGTPGNPASSKRQRIVDDIASIDAQIAKLQQDKADMAHNEVHREGRFKRDETTYDDPDKAKAIDAQIDDLKRQKAAREVQLRDLDSQPSSAPTPPPPNSLPPSGSSGQTPPPASGDAPK